MTATPYLSLECTRPTTLRERWLRLLRDLYALPAFHGDLMDELLPDSPKPALALVKGSGDHGRGTRHVHSSPALVPTAATHGRARLRLVVVGRDSEEQAPTQGDGDDIDVPDTPPPPIPPEGDVPRPSRRDDSGATRSSPRQPDTGASRGVGRAALVRASAPKRA